MNLRLTKKIFHFFLLVYPIFIGNAEAERVTARFGDCPTCNKPGKLFDTYLAEYSPELKVGNRNYVNFQTVWGTDHVLMRVNLAEDITPFRKVYSAKLRFFALRDEPGLVTTGVLTPVRAITDPSRTGAWEEAEVTFNNKKNGVPWKVGGTFNDVIGEQIGAIYFKQWLQLSQDFFDVELDTRTVQKWVDDPASNLGFAFNDSTAFNKIFATKEHQFSQLRPYLEVTYETDNPQPAAPQASNLKVVNHSGQSFITWKEIPTGGPACEACWYSPEFVDPKWGQTEEFSFVRREAEQTSSCRNICVNEKSYKIYRSAAPITTRNLDQAELIDQVYQGSSYLSTWPYDDPKAKQPNLSRIGVTLATDSGLYVHINERSENTYYAVTSVIEGRENRNIISGTNATSTAVLEKVGEPEPFYFEGDGQYEGYVIWLGRFNPVDLDDQYGFDNRRSVAKFFSTVKPKGGTSSPPYPLTLSLHAFGKYYFGSNDGGYAALCPFGGYTFDFNDMSRIVIKDDAGHFVWAGLYLQGFGNWGVSAYRGWNSNYVPTKKVGPFVPSFEIAKPYTDGKSVLYTMKTMRFLVKWMLKNSDFLEINPDPAKKGHSKIDPNRVYATGNSMGGGGSLSFALFNSDLVAAVNVIQGDLTFRTDTLLGRMVPYMGSLQDNIKTPEGVGIYDLMDLYKYVATHRGDNLPAIKMAHGKNDTLMGWDGQIPPFYEAAKNSRTPFVAYWDQAPHGDKDPAYYMNPSPAPAEPVPDVEYAETPWDPNYVAGRCAPKPYNPAFNFFAFRKDKPMVAFSNFSGDEPLSALRGRINGQIVNDVPSTQEGPGFFETKIFIVRTSTLTGPQKVDVTPRNLRVLKPLPGTDASYTVLDSNGSRLKMGTIKADSDRLFTIPEVPVSKTPVTVRLSTVLPPATPRGLKIQGP